SRSSGTGINAFRRGSMQVSLARTRRYAVLLSDFNFSEAAMKDSTFTRVFRLFALIGALLAFASIHAFAQQATIVGTVTDPSGAVIANAKVTATNTETGVVHTITTNESGQYVLPDTRIGHYDVKAEAPGLKIAEQKGVVLQVGDRARVDLQMQVGATTESVTFEAAGVRV